MSTNRKVTQVRTHMLFKKIKVAIYCRVSTPHEDQVKSLSNQISYYKTMVNNRVNWELVDIYADMQSGKNTSGRPEFQRMLEDCRNHKIDMIITKSISRFGRNTAETLDVLNKLRVLLVDVYFETEDINTSEKTKDFMVSIIQAVAQAESESRSSNIKWSLYKGFKNGTSKLYNRKCFGYQQDQDGNLIINKDEAQTVRKIFDLYLYDFSIIAIIRELKRLGIKSPTGKDAWSKRSIETLLSNEKYIGNVLLGKTYSKGYPDNERLINKDMQNKYLATNNHPPIISEEIFERVQAEKLRRSNIQIDNDVVKRKSTHYSMKKRGCNSD